MHASAAPKTLHTSAAPHTLNAPGLLTLLLPHHKLAPLLGRQLLPHGVSHLEAPSALLRIRWIEDSILRLLFAAQPLGVLVGAEGGRLWVSRCEEFERDVL